MDIFKNVPVVLEYINSNPVKNYILCANEMADVVAETKGLVSDFINIVNNAKIDFSGDSSITKHFPLDSKKDDGYNFLDRYERLTLANNIYSRLLQIKYKMEGIALTCQFCNGISDVLFAIDPESWAAYFTGKNAVEYTDSVATVSGVRNDAYSMCGVENTAAIMASEDLYSPAVEAVMMYDSPVSGWALPSAGELRALSASLHVVCHAMEVVGGDPFSDGQYLSSSQDGTTSESSQMYYYSVSLRNGFLTSTLKQTPGRVRSVLRIR